MASPGVVCDRLNLRHLLLLGAIGVSACDLSDLTDGKSGGGGTGGTGGNQAGGGSGGTGGGGNGAGGASTGGGGTGGTGGTGGDPTCESGSPFEWMIAIGNEESQAVSVTDDAPTNTLPSSIRVAEVPAALGGGFITVMLTTGVLDLAGPVGVDGARSIFVVHFSAAGEVIAAKAHTQPVEQVELPDQARSIDDIVVHETGRVFVVGRAGFLPLTLSSPDAPIELLTDGMHDDAFLAAFDLSGNALEAVRLVSTGALAASDELKGAVQARGLVALDGEIGVVGYYHRGLSFIDGAGQALPLCPALPTANGTKNGFIMMLPAQAPLSGCSRARAFVGTGDVRISPTSVTASDSQLLLAADFDVRTNSNSVEQQLTLNTSPAWVLDSAVDDHFSEAMVIALEQTMLTPEWVSLIETSGGVNDHAAAVSVDEGGTIWVVGKGVSINDVSNSIDVSRKFPSAAQTCTRTINTLKSRGVITALSPTGDCQAVVDYAYESSIESSLVLNGTPWFGGYATTSAFPPGQLASYGAAGLDPYGLLLSPTLEPANINAAGLLVGGPGRVRSYELSAVGDKILMAGIMSEGFLDLPCPSDAAAQVDFFLALYDPAQGP